MVAANKTTKIDRSIEKISVALSIRGGAFVERVSGTAPGPQIKGMKR